MLIHTLWSSRSRLGHPAKLNDPLSQAAPAAQPPDCVSYNTQGACCPSLACYKESRQGAILRLGSEGQSPVLGACPLQPAPVAIFHRIASYTPLSVGGSLGQHVCGNVHSSSPAAAFMTQHISSSQSLATYPGFHDLFRWIQCYFGAVLSFERRDRRWAAEPAESGSDVRRKVRPRFDPLVVNLGVRPGPRFGCVGLAEVNWVLPTLKPSPNQTRMGSEIPATSLCVQDLQLASWVPSGPCG